LRGGAANSPKTTYMRQYPSERERKEKNKTKQNHEMTVYKYNNIWKKFHSAQAYHLLPIHPIQSSSTSQAFTCTPTRNTPPPLDNTSCSMLPITISLDSVSVTIDSPLTSSALDSLVHPFVRFILNLTLSSTSITFFFNALTSPN